jgi:hypothetical protein
MVISEEIPSAPPGIFSVVGRFIFEFTEADGHEVEKVLLTASALMGLSSRK